LRKTILVARNLDGLMLNRPGRWQRQRRNGIFNVRNAITALT